MALIILKDMHLNYGERPLFNGISAYIQDTQKIGVVGRNGAGKSTLLKAIARQVPLDEGSIVVNQRKKIAYLPQDVVLNSDKTIFDEAFLAFKFFTDLEREKDFIEQQLDGDSDVSDILDRYQTVLDHLAHFDRVQAEARTHEVLTGLGFKESIFSEPVSSLSVGWKMRLVLAKLLLEQADFYLFDEPTNHLDITTKAWFLSFLQHAPFGYLLVSHDRHFLDKACDWILELARGNGTMYHGNYSSYLRQHQERQEHIKAAHTLQQKEISRKKETIARFKASSKARMAQSMQKQLDKIEIIEIEPPEPTISLSFGPMERSGKVVLTVEHVSYRYEEDKPLLNNVSCTIMRNQKVALVAPNGMGKSTLFNIITGKIPLQQGSVTFGYQVTYALFEQDQTKALDQHNTIIDELSNSCPQTTDVIRSFLGSFLFRGNDVYKKISMLSGGEKNRVAMVKVLLQQANFLLLDEPTNHLDLQSKAVLLQALQQYPGTILFVSHDHQFIQELATDILELTPTGLHFYPGSYESFLKEKNTGIHHTTTQKQKTVETSHESKEATKRLRQAERHIHTLEQAIEKKSLLLSLEAYGTPGYTALFNEITSLQKALKTAMDEWESLA